LRKLAAVLLLLLSISCAPSGPAPIPRAYLFEKGPYQALYGPDGRILRLLYDRNQDRVADVVTLFYPSGQPRQIEIDSNLDGMVERWESYDVQRRLVKVASSRRSPGRPDLWEYFNSSGRVQKREVDENGDDRPDRIELFAEGQLVRVEIDGDAEGRMDRWQEWRSGRLWAEALDTDGDGEPDRRIRFGPNGDVIGMERLGR